ncbi:sialin-like [Uloborus diversus]|uniref:sialin-like n=1 Tax=Uloborus diversus TaxID=327109 RepID=UPI00240A8ABE|nr:sialin-like [Uloborus diversus]
MALVKMTADQNQNSATGSVSECPAGNYSMSSSVKHGETFHWSRAMQSQIISASFIGFVITQIPGGRLSETLGAKQILTLSLVVASLCNIFSPNAAKYSPYALLILQMIKGMFLHSTVPWKAMLSSRATWALIVGLFGQFWFFYYFLSIHTVYLESALHFDITQPKNEQWHRVLYISVGVGLASGLIFNLFGSAALQNWKRDEDERNETETPDVQNADEDSCAIEDTFDGEVMTTRL